MATGLKGALACATGGDSDDRLPRKQRRALGDTTNKPKEPDAGKKRQRKSVAGIIKGRHKVRFTTETSPGNENKSINSKSKTSKRRSVATTGAKSEQPTSPGREIPWDLSKLSVAIDRILPPFIVDIDANPDGLNTNSYAKDIFHYLMMKELTYTLSLDYLKNNSDINTSMRAVLFDWLLQVQDYLNIEEETLHLTVSITDKYLDLSRTSLSNLQLVGITSFLIATKLVERSPPDINQLTQLTEDTYTYRQVLQMEQRILIKLNFNIVIPGPLDFLPRFLKVMDSDVRTEKVCRYLFDLCLIDLPCAHIAPSQKAAGCLCLVRHIEREETIVTHPLHATLAAPSRISMQLRMTTLRNRASLTPFEYSRDHDHATANTDTAWPDCLIYYTTYTVSQLRPVMVRLAKLLARVEGSKYQAAYNKYSSPKLFSTASLWEPLRSSPVLADLNPAGPQNAEEL